MDLPNHTNFYVAFNHPTKTLLKDFLKENGWVVRKESWKDFECTNEWSDLYLTGSETNVLLNGVLKKPETNYRKLLQLFSKLNANFHAELYDENKNLLFEDRSMQEIIKEPLWDLMISTNDCSRGCGCDQDFFNITSERIRKWRDNENNKSEAKEALIQLDALLEDENLDFNALSDQVYVPFKNLDEARKWLRLWKVAASKGIDSFLEAVDLVLNSNTFLLRFPSFRSLSIEQYLEQLFVSGDFEKEFLRHSLERCWLNYHEAVSNDQYVPRDIHKKLIHQIDPLVKEIHIEGFKEILLAMLTLKNPIGRYFSSPYGEEKKLMEAEPLVQHFLENIGAFHPSAKIYELEPTFLYNHCDDVYRDMDIDLSNTRRYFSDLGSDSAFACDNGSDFYILLTNGTD